MPRQLLRTTVLSESHPLIYQGVRAPASFRQLEQVIASRLGRDAALLFSEPVFDSGRDTISWYTSLEGEAVALSSLYESGQAGAREEIGRRARELRDLAGSLKNSSDSNSQMAGTLLEMALTFSDSEAVFVLKGRPVVTGWGLVPGNPAVEAVPVTVKTIRLLDGFVQSDPLPE